MYPRLATPLRRGSLPLHCPHVFVCKLSASPHCLYLACLYTPPRSTLLPIPLDISNFVYVLAWLFVAACTRASVCVSEAGYIAPPRFAAAALLACSRMHPLRIFPLLLSRLSLCSSPLQSAPHTSRPLQFRLCVVLTLQSRHAHAPVFVYPRLATSFRRGSLLLHCPHVVVCTLSAYSHCFLSRLSLCSSPLQSAPHTSRPLQFRYVWFLLCNRSMHMIPQVLRLRSRQLVSGSPSPPL